MFGKEETNMITTKREMADIIKKTQTETLEMKNVWDENIEDGGSNDRLDIAEEKVSKLRDIATEITLNKILKRKNGKNKARISFETTLSRLTCGLLKSGILVVDWMNFGGKGLFWGREWNRIEKNFCRNNGWEISKLAENNKSIVQWSLCACVLNHFSRVRLLRPHGL